MGQPTTRCECGKRIPIKTKEAGVRCAGARAPRLARRANAPSLRGTVTGSRGGNAALAELLSKLASTGVIADGSSA
jgi:hypothetical protein